MARVNVRKREWTDKHGAPKSAWVVDFFDPAGKRKRRQFAKRKEADAFRDEIAGAIRSGAYRGDAAETTLADACSKYLKHAAGRQERGERMTRHHLATMTGHVHKHILGEHGIGAIRLDRLTSRTVADFRDRIRSAGVSVPTTRKVLATLSAVLEYAISRDLIAVNGARGVKVIGRRDEGSKKITPPSKAAMRALIENADPDFKVRLVFAAATGVRAGELHALRWRHLDLKAGEVTIETRVDAYREEDVTKTAAGMRTVPLSAAVVKMLKAWRLRSSFAKADHLVFPNRKGKYEGHANMVKRRFNPACEAARLGEHVKVGEDETGEPVTRFKRSINWHALRHFAVSTWIEAGMSPKTVQTFAGHSSLQVTMDRYGHLFPSDDHRRAMDAIAGEMFS